MMRTWMMFRISNLTLQPGNPGEIVLHNAQWLCPALSRCRCWHAAGTTIAAFACMQALVKGWHKMQHNPWDQVMLPGLNQIVADWCSYPPAVQCATA